MTLNINTNFTPAPSSAKFSELPVLSQLTGEELILVALNGKNYTVPKSAFASGTEGPTVFGPTQLYITEVYSFAITNYDMLQSYTVSVSAGSVSAVNPQTGGFTFTAPAVAGPVTLTVNSNQYVLNILPAQTNTPDIIVPTNGATIYCKNILVKASAFTNTGPIDTQLAANWQIATDSAFTNIVQQSLNDTVNLNQYLFTNLPLSTTLYIRVSYVGHIAAVSQYSPVVSVTTAAYTYPVQEVYELSAPIPTNGYDFGYCLATNASDTILVVGAPSYANPSGTKDSVFIYDTTTFPYALIQEIDSPAPPTLNNGLSVGFGSTVALSSDGNLLIIGAPEYSFSITSTSGSSGTATTTNNIYTGAFFVYIRNGSTYTLSNIVESPVYLNNFNFGWQIQLSADNSTLAVSGNILQGPTGTSALFVYSVTQTNGVYSFQLMQSFTDPNYIANTVVSGGQYAQLLAVSNNGSVIATLSQWQNNSTSVSTVKILIYSLLTGVWSTTSIDLPTLINQPTTMNLFATSLALSQDASTLIIGNPNTSSYSNESVYILKNQNGTWTLSQTLQSPVNSANYYSYFGFGVKLSPDASLLAVIGNSIYIYQLVSGQYQYIATLQTNSTTINWNPITAYFTMYLSNILVFSGHNSRLFAGNPNGTLGIVYTFSCYQNPNLVVINPGGSSGACGGSS